MFAKIKKWFSPAQPHERMIPIDIVEKIEVEKDLKNLEEEMKEEREWIYMGDGMMEEVIKPYKSPSAQRPLATHIANTRATHFSSNRTTHSDPSVPMTTVYADSSYNGDYSTCDGGNSSCD